MIPNFIIVGAMKSGSSTLAYYLRNQKSIYMPKREIHFFDNRGGYKENWKKGIDWYESQFKNASEKQVIGEKTPTYSYLPGVPSRIKKCLPNAKIIWIFRNPVDRAYSNYWHAVCGGNELASFSYAVEYEQERMKKHFWRGYVDRSIYIKQVENYLNYFSLNNMYFSTLEKLKEDPAKVINNICEFIGADFKQENIPDDRVRNETYMPQSKYLRYLITNLFGRRYLLSRIERKINKKQHPGYPAMDQSLREDLIERLKVNNERLEKVTGLDLDYWQT